MVTMPRDVAVRRVPRGSRALRMKADLARRSSSPVNAGRGAYPAYS